MKKTSTCVSGPARRSLGKGGFFNLRITIALLVCTAGVCSFVSGIVPTFLRPQTKTNFSKRTLTFEERVSYQRAIEEVYWRHRIWPKERPDPKPSLDAVMSQAQLEKKVRDYLRNSQALEDYWQRPITAKQLQAEIDRMAKNTKQPEALRELFDALGNDPFVIAECLARPALAGRLLTNWYAHDQRIHGELKVRAEADLQAHTSVEQMKQTGGECSEIELIKSDSARDEDHRGADHGMKLNSHEWDQTIHKLSAAFNQPAAPIGSALRNGGLQSAAQQSTGTWDDYETVPVGKLSALQEDEGHYYATAVIQKTKGRVRLATVSWSKEPLESWLARTEAQMPTPMTAPSGDYTLPSISDGGCIDDSWTDMAGPPDGRWWHTAIWTGSEMIVWGGFRYESPYPSLNSGGRYSPATDSWIATSPANAPAPRYNHTAVWTGSEMIVWGGTDFGGNHFNTGGRYDPGTDSWTATGTASAPTNRESHTAIWTGSEMIVWGGYDGSTELNSGARYNPGTNGWTATTLTNAPAGRYGHTAVWTGSEMIIWGGFGLNTGGRYNPSTNTWTATNTTNAPDGRVNHIAVWTGSDMIIWGGDNGGSPFNTGGRYDPDTNSWTATSTTNAPDGRSYHTSVWTGAEMIIWGGFGAGGDLDSGGRYDPATNSWTATSVLGTPTGREAPTAIWTGTEMIVWGGRGNALRYPNAGGRYNPTTDSWTRTGETPNPRRYHTTVWTGTEMIVWGGALQDGGNPYSNTGGRYNSATDNWTLTSTANAPSARAYHTALWTGSEMIIWGGFNFDDESLNTGGRYDPSADSWTATSTANAPVRRDSHTAVWTGTDMVVWGGYFYDGNDHYLNTGGKYNPNTDSWTAISLTNVPDGRSNHTAVWTGNEMIVWGGFNYDFGYLNTGGTYNLGLDRWTSTSLINAPEGRSGHSAVWIGSEMIVWGGYYLNGNFYYFNTGGRYNPGTNSWVATTTDDAPDARGLHSAVWTGSEMIVWGGLASDETPYFNKGGRYDPGTNSWTATSTDNAPAGRYRHTATWIGTEMIIWAGVLYTNTYTNTGGRYCAQPGSPTPTPTPTATPRVTPRPHPTPRVRPTPH